MSAEDDLALATAVIAGIKELLALHESAKSGALAPADALQAAQLLTDHIAANKKAALDALAAKFKTP